MLEWKTTSMAGIETKLLVRPRFDWVDVRMSQRVGIGSNCPGQLPGRPRQPRL